MQQTHRKRLVAVILLTLLAGFSATGCSLVRDYIGEGCKTRAYVRSVLADHITTRYHSGAPVRMAVIPFSVPANLAGYDVHRPGFGEIVARQIHAKLLASGVVPIVEVLNRKEWPGKHEEFFTGNFGALSQAREAGYDLVLVGYVEPYNELDRITAYSKVIEAESGITVWYGRTVAVSRRDDLDAVESRFWLADERPALLYPWPLADALTSCIVREVLTEEVSPE